jgi:hypothetical protein
MPSRGSGRSGRADRLAVSVLSWSQHRGPVTAPVTQRNDRSVTVVERIVERIRDSELSLRHGDGREGHIERLPSGSFRVHVYAGTDPVTGKERRLKRTVATQERAARELARLLEAANGGRTPEDSATVGLVLDRYLEVADLGVSTRLTHESYIRRIIRPVLGDLRLRNLDQTPWMSCTRI